MNISVFDTDTNTVRQVSKIITDASDRLYIRIKSTYQESTLDRKQLSLEVKQVQLMDSLQNDDLNSVIWMIMIVIIMNVLL